MNLIPKRRRTLLYFLSFSLIAAPLYTNFIQQAEARAGRGGSMGSRGSRTYQVPGFTRSAPQGAQPFGRTMTSPSYTPRPNNGFNPNMNAPRMAPPMRAPSAPARPAMAPSTGSSFLRGLVGGVIGMSAYNMLFGHRSSQAAAPGQQPNATDQQQTNVADQQQTQQHNTAGSGIWSVIKFALIALAVWLIAGMGIFKLALLALVIWLVIRWFRRRNSQNNMTGSSSARNTPKYANPINTYTQQSNIQLSDADYTTFQQRLVQIQDAWTRQDLAGLQKITTPEMLSYFNEQLTDLASKGLHNTVSDVRFEQGDLSEAWTEGNREYATVSIRYSLIDVTTDNTGRVVDGNPNQRQVVTEFWTFVRAANNNWWLLSGIQQPN